MRIAAQHPHGIKFFAALYVAAAATAFAGYVSNLSGLALALEEGVPEADWSSGSALIVALVRLGIALGAVAFVWFFASRVAKWVAVLFAVFKLYYIPIVVEAYLAGYEFDMFYVASSLIAMAALVGLFTRASARWFEAKGRTVAETFE